MFKNLLKKLNPRNRRLAVRVARKYANHTGNQKSLETKLAKDEELAGIDPATILIIAQIVMEIIKLIQKWRENKQSVLQLEDNEILAELNNQ